MRRDWTGTVLGLLVFGLGAYLLWTVYGEARTMYAEPPGRTLGVVPGGKLDLPDAGSRLAGTLVKVLLLALMAFVGGLVCRAGVQLYGRSLLRAPKES